MNRAMLSAGLFVILTFACGHENVPEETGKWVAKAGSEQLSADQFRRRFIQSPYVRDSAFNAKRSIEAWAVESLFYQEAVRRLKEEEMQIEAQVADYRKTLVNYIYENKLVEVNLDTTVSRDEIEAYYRDHRSSFILKENIVKVDYFKVPSKSGALEKIRKLVQSQKAKDMQLLSALLAQHAENFYLNDSTWLYIEDVKKEVPQLTDEPDYMLSPGRTLEFSDESYYYYLKIKDLKTKNAMSPLNFEWSNIRKFILNSRKTQLINQYKSELMEKAKKDGRFVTYSRKEN
jgi:hypothetical protein